MSLFSQLYRGVSTVQLGVRSCVYPQVLPLRLFTLVNVSGITSINTKTSAAMHTLRHTLDCVRVFWRRALSLWGMWKLCALIHKHFCRVDTWSEMLLHGRAPTQHVGQRSSVCLSSVCLPRPVHFALCRHCCVFVCFYAFVLCFACRVKDGRLSLGLQLWGTVWQWHINLLFFFFC